MTGVDVRSLPPGVAWLFCPADRPERFDKAAAAADVVILDLEDGVAPAHRAAAREAVAAAAERLDAGRTVVRVNQAGTADHELDVAALAGLPFRTLMLAKAESPQDLSGLGQWSVVALCETARGVLAAQHIASAPECVGLMWGAEDLIADLGGSSSRGPGGGYRGVAALARHQVLLAAAAAGVAALDSVYLALDDPDGLRVESEDAAQSGFAGKVCLHPRQVPVVRAAYRPTPSEIDWAERVVAAMTTGADSADGRPGGVPHGAVQVDGRMVDEPILRHARRMLARAAATP